MLLKWKDYLTLYMLLGTMQSPLSLFNGDIAFNKCRPSENCSVLVIDDTTDLASQIYDWATKLPSLITKLLCDIMLFIFKNCSCHSYIYLDCPELEDFVVNYWHEIQNVSLYFYALSCSSFERQDIFIYYLYILGFVRICLQSTRKPQKGL